MDTEQTMRLVSIRNMAMSGEARRIRIRAGLSLDEVAEPCGVARTTIYRWEQRHRKPTGEAALRYLNLLESLDALRS